MKAVRSVVSWRIDRVWPGPPKTTSWWATNPGRRTECTRTPSTSAPRAPGCSSSPAGVAGVSSLAAAIARAVAERGAARRIHLRVVVEFDHLGRRHRAGCLRGEPHHQHGADREVRRDQDVRVGAIGQLPELVERSRGDPGGADDAWTPCRGRPAEGVHDRVGRREVDRDLAHRRRARLGRSRTDDHDPRSASPTASGDRSPRRGRGRDRRATARQTSRPIRPVAPTTPTRITPWPPGTRSRRTGPSTVRVIGCDSTRSATRRASSRVTRSIRRSVSFTVRISPCAISDLPSRLMRPPGSSSAEHQRSLHVPLRPLELRRR